MAVSLHISSLQVLKIRSPAPLENQIGRPNEYVPFVSALAVSCLVHYFSTTNFYLLHAQITTLSLHAGKVETYTVLEFKVHLQPTQTCSEFLVSCFGMTLITY